MKNLIFIFSVLTFVTAANAEVFHGKIEQAVGAASHLNGTACTINILSHDSESIHINIEVMSSRTIKDSALLTKSDRYIFEKALGYDYASHKSLQDKFLQTDISNLLKIDQAKAIFIQEYRRKDISDLFADSIYYKYVCKAFR